MKKSDKILLISTIVLLFLAAVALPIASVITYALHETRSPNHVLNYETNRLYWDTGTENIDENGVYQLSLFDSLPTGEDGEKIVSPGDEAKNVIQIRNKTGHSIEYKAVLYKISKDNVPIEADFTNVAKSDDVRIYTLPDGVLKTDVIRAVGGKIEAYDITSLDVEWKWEYFVSDEQDAMDTILGNLSSSDVTVGIWFTVTDTIEIDTEYDDINVDTNGDGIPDINIDTDGDNEAEINIDIDGDTVPDTNIDVNGDMIPDLSIDLDGDKVGDFNFDSNGDNIPDTDVLELRNENGAVIITPDAMQIIVDKFEDHTELTLKLDNLGQYVNAVDIPTDKLAELADGLDSLEIVMTNLRASFDKAALESMLKQASADSIRIVVKEILKEELSTTQQNVLEKHQLAVAVKAYVYSGNTVITDFEGGKIKIAIPYTAYKNTRIIDYKVYDFKANGELIDLGAAYENGFFVFESESYSEYVVLYHGKTDISGLEPEPPECNCMICLFGGNCTYCWLCWSFIIILALAIFVFIIITLQKYIK